MRSAPTAVTATVVKAMDEITAIAVNTQKGAEGTVATVGELRQLSGRLLESIQRFKVAG